MGNKVSAPTLEDFARPHATGTVSLPPFSEVVYPVALEEGLTFTLSRNAWTQGCIIPELGIQIVPDHTAKHYQGSKCYVYKTVPPTNQQGGPSNEQQRRLVAVLSSYDAFRVRIYTLTQPSPTSIIKDDYQGRALFEYAVVTKKRDSTQHLLHFPWTSSSSSSSSAPARLATTKFYVKGLRHRIVHPWNDRTDVWGAIYDQPDNTTWRIQTSAGIDPLLLLGFVLSTDRFVQYVDNQHVRRTALLNATTAIGGKA
jgi:hypothetical protein